MGLKILETRTESRHIHTQYTIQNFSNLEYSGGEDGGLYVRILGKTPCSYHCGKAFQAIKLPNKDYSIGPETLNIQTGHEKISKCAHYT